MDDAIGPQAEVHWNWGWSVSMYPRQRQLTGGGIASRIVADAEERNVTFHNN